MVKLRKIVYMRKKDININGLSSIDKLASKNIGKANPMTEMIIRLLIDDENKVHIEYANIISIDNIREAANFVEGLVDNKSHNDFTQDEHYHLSLTKLICDWDTNEISAEEAMKKIMNLNIKHIDKDKILEKDIMTDKA